MPIAPPFGPSIHPRTRPSFGPSENDELTRFSHPCFACFPPQPPFSRPPTIDYRPPTDLIHRSIGPPHSIRRQACNAESYTTSASFLLRLLVDEKHVCIVAVAKPLPVPEPLPSMDTIHARESKPKSPYGPDFGFGDALGPAPQGFGLGGLGLAGGYALSNSSATSSTEDLSSTPTDSLLSSSPRFAHAHGHGRSQSGSNMGALTELTSGTSISTSPPHAGSATGTDKEKDKDKDKPCLLAGPVHLAPPRAVRVMAAPPPRGSRGILLETETIVGVASAHITVAPPAPEETWADLNVPSGSPHGVSDGSFGSTQHRAARSKVPAKEAHILTLSVAPSERGQGLGARLLDELLSEIQSRSSSRGGSPRSLPASASSLTTTFATSSNPPPPSHPTTRAYLEVHPSNTRATSLYASRGFERARGERGTKRGFYRGDERICVAERLKVGGTDAVVLERLF